MSCCCLQSDKIDAFISHKLFCKQPISVECVSDADTGCCVSLVVRMNALCWEVKAPVLKSAAIFFLKSEILPRLPVSLGNTALVKPFHGF